MRLYTFGIYFPLNQLYNEGKSFCRPDFFMRKNFSSFASSNSFSLTENFGSSVLGAESELYYSCPSINASEH